MNNEPPNDELEARVRELVMAGEEGRRELNELLRTNEQARPLAAKALFEEAALTSQLRMESVTEWAENLRPRRVLEEANPAWWRKNRRPLVATLAAAACVVLSVWIYQNDPKPSDIVQPTINNEGSIGWVRRLEGETTSSQAKALAKDGTLDLGNERVRVDLDNGVVVSVTGPARLRIALKECRLWSGQVSVDVPKDLATYVVETDNGRFVDLGTTFSVAVQPGKRTEMAVLSGMVRAERISYEGDILSEQLVRKSEGVVLDGTVGAIRSVKAGELDHQLPIALEDLDLPVPEAYREAVESSGPLLVWDFENQRNDSVFSNRVGPAMAGVVHGDIRIQQNEKGGGHIVLGENDAGGWVESAEPWRKNDADPFTIELWARPDRVQWGHLLNLRVESSRDPVTRREPLGPLSYFAMELTHTREFLPLPTEPSIRCIFRSPATEHPLETTPGGLNSMLVSPARYIPGKWYHLVARVDRQEFALFVDGEVVARQSVQRPPLAEQDLMLRLGSMRHRSWYNRQFIGAIDEFAIYPKALSDTEILDHFRTMVGAGTR
jgi:ferric-dicitrate binding protein FerR (iron transport regulator)